MINVKGLSSIPEDNVVILNMVTRLDLPVERVIKGAQETNLKSVVVVGWDKNGDLYFASSKADGAEVLWLLEVAKKKLLAAGGSRE